jgi:hypothetical protein
MMCLLHRCRRILPTGPDPQPSTPTAFLPPESFIQFMTLFYLNIDAAKMHAHWVRVGHEPAIFYDPATDAFEEPGGSGIALGIEGDWRYKEYLKTDLDKGQIIFLSTDGIWEALKTHPVCKSLRIIIFVTALYLILFLNVEDYVSLTRGMIRKVTLLFIALSEDIGWDSPNPTARIRLGSIPR